MTESQPTIQGQLQLAFLTYRIEIRDGTSCHDVTTNSCSIPNLFSSKPAQHLNNLKTSPVQGSNLKNSLH